MIYIIDNGEDYSAHCIYFVRTLLGSETVEKLTKLARYERGSRIEGTTEKIDWRAEDGCCSAGDYFPVWEMFVTRDDVTTLSPAWSVLTLDEIEQLIPEWEKWAEGLPPAHRDSIVRVREEVARRREGA